MTSSGARRRAITRGPSAPPAPGSAVEVDLDAPTADGACPALSRAVVAPGRCTVRPARAMVCRLWGMVASMPCPHGCAPAGGLLDDTAAMDLLAASLDAGGHRDAGLSEPLAVCG